MGVISDQLNNFWAAKKQMDQINQAKGQIQGSVNQLQVAVTQVKALIDAGVLDGLAQDSRAALKKAHKYISDCLTSIQTDANIQELLNWTPPQ